MSGPLQQLKTQLAAHGIRPRKALGQNFLVDPNFARAVAREAAADERTLVLEVGPGTGVLTRALLETHPRAQVLAVELDRGLTSLLEETFAQELASRRLVLLTGDVLESKHRLAPEVTERLLELSRTEQRSRRVLCANLPYNVATPLIANLMLPLGGHEGAAGKAGAPLVEKIVATIQWELAQRLLGAPGTADYGPLSVWLALRGSGSIVRRVGPQVFWPRPQVDSAVLALSLHPWAGSPIKEEEAAPFQAFLQSLFQQRRKTLRATLRERLRPDHPLAKARAEDLTPLELLALFRLN